MDDSEPFSNPVAPQGFIQPHKPEPAQPLTNDDFRKLLFTPRPGSSATPAASLGGKKSVTLDDNKKKKKKLYATFKKQEDETLSELAKKYR